MVQKSKRSINEYTIKSFPVSLYLWSLKSSSPQANVVFYLRIFAIYEYIYMCINIFERLLWPETVTLIN